MVQLVALLLALTMLIARPEMGRAENSGVEKYKRFSPAQIKDMNDEERHEHVPMKYIFAAQKALAIDGQLALAMDLNALMYPGIGDYVTAVKMFQKDLGDEETGSFTVAQIHELTVRSEFQRVGPLSFPTPHNSYITSDIAFASGTMVILDDKIAWPVNYSTLTCYKAESYCERLSTYLSLPKEEDWARMYTVQEVARDNFRITRWEDKQIDAVPFDKNTCRTVTLNLNFATNEFFEIGRNAGGDCEVLGVAFPKLDKPRISKLVDGKEIVRQELASIQKKAYGFLSSAFRMKVEALSPQLSSKSARQ